MPIDPGVDLAGVEVQDLAPLDAGDAPLGYETPNMAHGHTDAVSHPGDVEQCRPGPVVTAQSGLVRARPLRSAVGAPA